MAVGERTVGPALGEGKRPAPAKRLRECLLGKGASGRAPEEVVCAIGITAGLEGRERRSGNRPIDDEHATVVVGDLLPCRARPTDRFSLRRFVHGVCSSDDARPVAAAS